MRVLERSRPYRVRYMDPFFGDRHGDTVWAGSLDDAVERAWAQARHEDWQVRVVSQPTSA